MRIGLAQRFGLGVLALLVASAPAFAAGDRDVSARTLGGACYWQTAHGLSESALAFRDRVQRALGFDLFQDCTVTAQSWGETTITCAATNPGGSDPSGEASTWTLTLRIGFPGGLQTWQACITKIERPRRVVYEASFLFRYRAQIVAACVLYGVYALGRTIRRRRRR
jgi:hypothetical protein